MDVLNETTNVLKKDLGVNLSVSTNKGKVVMIDASRDRYSLEVSNLVSENFHVERPNTVWQTDIKECW